MKAGTAYSALFAPFHSSTPGIYVEAAPSGTGPSRLSHELVQAGWQGLHLAVVDRGRDTDIDALLAEAHVGQVHLMLVRGHAAIRAIGTWHGAACRPLAILVETGPFGAPAAANWRAALARNGYMLAASDDRYYQYIRDDHMALHAQVAEYAGHEWRRQLQEARSTLALARQELEQVRGTLSMVQARELAAKASATVAQQQIAAIYTSSSWKSTKLLRWAGRLRLEPGPTLRELRTLVRTRLLASLRRQVARLGARLESHPRLRRGIAAAEARFPSLAQRLKKMLGPAQSVPAPNAPAMPPSIAPGNITGPQFKTRLLEKIEHGLPPTSHQG